MKICILLATYNGESFLKEQLDSLINQTEKNWFCLIRDDGSQDKTLEIIKNYCVKDSRFFLLMDEEGPQGNAKDNFSLLMQAGLKTKANYFLFSDQDDVWMHSKIEILCSEFTKHNINRPFLIHHDLEVVCQDLTILSPSFIDFSRLDSCASFARLLGRNTVTGCATACNRKLIEIILPIPPDAIMHDWWLGLTASYLGELYFLDKALIKYRQHNGNVLGARPFRVRVPLLLTPEKIKNSLFPFYKTILQAKAFLRLIDGNKSLSRSNYSVLKMYCQILSITRFQRIQTAFRFGYFQKNWFIKGKIFIKLLLYTSKFHDMDK
ncbi:hypothetical protein CW745_10430 [Psychromonas sp. psych-6C06]|uniref:glycosyltransferase family 2 protein n=1 Tax=Psychromonas sp. psych-6C06 TaxID=2058089 RepID=UPI000C326C88|nr:glycosyltransferase family 2 protein [Psychromonas sp. psych-6C06]PKF61726.1 hypothetical protein CW745_10430 [Psychromonas sp. psych-6C06]